MAEKPIGARLPGQPARRTKRGAASTPTLKLAVQYALPAKELPVRGQFRRWVRAALEQDAEITLRIVDEAEGRALNYQFRGKDYATNVLSFAYGTPAPGLPLLADIVLCAPVLAREASEQGKMLFDHYAHLTIHGVLHVQSYDHDSVHEARIMETREVEILSHLGVYNPY